MDTKIQGRDGSATFISGSYAPFGVKVVGGPERQEDPSQWRVKWLKRNEICKRLNWTSEQFAAAQTLGFPEARESTTTAWHPKRIIEFKEELVLAWVERVRSLALK